MYNNSILTRIKKYIIKNILKARSTCCVVLCDHRSHDSTASLKKKQKKSYCNEQQIVLRESYRIFSVCCALHKAI